MIWKGGQEFGQISGIPTIINEMEKAGLPSPVFENGRRAFKVTLYSDDLARKAKERQANVRKGVSSAADAP